MSENGSERVLRVVNCPFSRNFLISMNRFPTTPKNKKLRLSTILMVVGGLEGVKSMSIKRGCRGSVSSSFRIAGNKNHMKMGLKRSSEARKWYIKFATVEGLGEQKWLISQEKSGEIPAICILLPT
jgi:hypothetical protein